MEDPIAFTRLFHEPVYGVCFLCHEDKELDKRVEFPVRNYLVREPTNAPQWVCWLCWNGPLRTLERSSRIHPIPILDLASSERTVYKFVFEPSHFDDSDTEDTDEDMPALISF